MEQKKIRIIGISGSLRPASSAGAILDLVAKLVPADIDFSIYTGLENIPPFNDSNQVPVQVTDLIQLIIDADGVFFCIPEYAFGVPGALKNALDWTVSSTAFSDKPVALITAASSGEKAHTALLFTLAALGTRIPDGATLLISFIRAKLNEKKEVTDLPTMEAIKKTVNTFIRAIGSAKGI